jgi:hypothetical protein
MAAARLIELPIVPEPRGNLSFLEHHGQVPFVINRVSWFETLSGDPADGCAFRHTDEIIVALSGRVDVSVDDGEASRTYVLNRACVALHVPSMHWRELHTISADAVIVVLGSSRVGEDEAVRHIDDFRRLGRL